MVLAPSLSTVWAGKVSPRFAWDTRQCQISGYGTDTHPMIALLRCCWGEASSGVGAVAVVVVAMGMEVDVNGDVWRWWYV